MDSFSGTSIALTLIGFVILIVVLVALFYKPPKKLLVNCKFKDANREDLKSIIDIEVENVGKKRLKMQPPYVKFSHANSSKLFQIKSDKLQCKFPRVIKIGEKVSCDIDLGQYIKSLEESNFKPTHLKVYMDDTAGLRFQSKTLELKN